MEKEKKSCLDFWFTKFSGLSSTFLIKFAYLRASCHLLSRSYAMKIFTCDYDYHHQDNLGSRFSFTFLFFIFLCSHFLFRLVCGMKMPNPKWLRHFRQTKMFFCRTVFNLFVHDKFKRTFVCKCTSKRADKCVARTLIYWKCQRWVVESICDRKLFHRRMFSGDGLSNKWSKGRTTERSVIVVVCN